MGVHLYTNGAWTDSGKIYRNSLNIFDKNATDVSNGYRVGYYLTSNGTENSSTSAVPFDISEYIDIDSITKITLSPLYTSGSSSPAICFYDSSKAYISGANYGNNETITVNVPNNANYCRFSIPLNNINSVMLNEGSTTLPYEPYNIIDWYTNHGHGYSSGVWS